jgi:hypothetical protein
LAHSYFSGLVVNNIHPFEGAVNHLWVTHVTLEKLCFRIQILWSTVAVYLIH